KSFIGFTASLVLYFSGINTLYAKIPDELLYQPPKNVQSTQLATLVGFQKLNALQLIKARIYLTYINDKATLNRSHDWNKVYEISPGLTDIRLVDTIAVDHAHQLLLLAGNSFVLDHFRFS
ncbi:hypothetical protein AB0861_021265, partial [Acinetobacter baumannii]